MIGRQFISNDCFRDPLKCLFVPFPEHAEKHQESINLIHPFGPECLDCTH